MLAKFNAEIKGCKFDNFLKVVKFYHFGNFNFVHILLKIIFYFDTVPKPDQSPLIEPI
jgi:hypothetical protein